MASLRFLYTASLALFGAARALPSTSQCAPVSGNFSIENFQLYPENVDWDPVGCKLYLSGLFNSSVMVYDPYTTQYEIITYDGVTHNEEYHASGIDYDPFSKSMYFIVNAAAAFVTRGANLSGPASLIRYDPAQKTTLFKADLTGFQSDVLSAVGVYPGGAQDVAVDKDGNAYVPFTYGTTAIARVSATGEVTSFYSAVEKGTNASANAIYGGIIYHPNGKLVISDAALGVFVTFDTSASTGTQVAVTMSDFPSDYTAVSCDGLLNPARYNYELLLCSEDGINAVTVFSLNTDLTEARYLGRVNNTADSGLPTATVQIVNSVYTIEEFFLDSGVFDQKGNRSTFPIFDFTSGIDSLATAAGISITDC